MKITTEQRKIIEWNHKGFGLFQCTIWNGKITDLRFNRNGSRLEGECLYASEGGEEFLKKVYESLGELFDELKGVK